MNRAEITTLRGIVVASDWDRDGRTTRTAVVTYDEKRCLVVDNETGRELLPHLKERVVVAGSIGKNKDRMTIDVTAHHIDTEKTA